MGGGSGYRGRANIVGEVVGEGVVWACGAVSVGGIVGGNGSDSSRA